MSDEQQTSAPQAPEPAPAPARQRLRTALDVWMLGIFSVLGLVGFIATFALIMVRSPGAPVQHALSDAELRRLVGPQGERGPAGPAGARGPAGDAPIRILRVDCTAGNCTAECNDDEILLSAYCSPNRSPVAYPTEHSAVCRAQIGRVKVEVVAACLKASRR